MVDVEVIKSAWHLLSCSAGIRDEEVDFHSLFSNFDSQIPNLSLLRRGQVLGPLYSSRVCEVTMTAARN